MGEAPAGAPGDGTGRTQRDGASRALATTPDFGASPFADEHRAHHARGGWRAVLDAAMSATRGRPGGERERDLLSLRSEAFQRIERKAPRPPADTSPSLPIYPSVGLPVLRGPLDAGIVRATIAAHGSVVVPGLLSGPAVAALRGAIETALAAAEEVSRGVPHPGAEGWYHPWPSLRHPLARAFAAGCLAVDSPLALARYVEVLEDVGLLEMVRGYFGGEVAISGEKALFRTTNEVPPAGYGWHQDGIFLGGERIRALDVWITLTAAGRTAPGLEILPRRVDRLLPPGALLDWDLSSEIIERHYPGFHAVVPALEPGDAVLFDQLCVHRTGGPQHPSDTRISSECWMFGPESVPEKYTGFLL